MYLVDKSTSLQVPLESVLFEVDILGTRIARIQMI